MVSAWLRYVVVNGKGYWFQAPSRRWNWTQNLWLSEKLTGTIVAPALKHVYLIKAEYDCLHGASWVLKITRRTIKLRPLWIILLSRTLIAHVVCVICVSEDAKQTGSKRTWTFFFIKSTSFMEWKIWLMMMTQLVSVFVEM